MFILLIYSLTAEGWQCLPCRPHQGFPLELSGQPRVGEYGVWAPGFCGRLYLACVKDAMADKELKADIPGWAGLLVAPGLGALFSCGASSGRAEWGEFCADRSSEAISMLPDVTAAPDIEL